MKKLIFFTLFVFTTSAMIFGFDYWYMDVTVENYLTRTSSVERAYFFRDLRTLEEATGFPIKANATGYDRFRWLWRPTEGNYERNSYFDKIFTQMHREGFGAAFVLFATGTDIYGGTYYLYNVFLISNSKQFMDSMTVHRPVRF